MDNLMPPEVAFAQAREDASMDTMWPEEIEAMSSTTESRRREYATVRHCARQALSILGIDPVPILNDDKRCPQWPTGIVGSMTHCRGYRAAAVARAESYRTLGLDAEPALALPPGVLMRITNESEREHLNQISHVGDGSHQGDGSHHLGDGSSQIGDGSHLLGDGSSYLGDGSLLGDGSPWDRILFCLKESIYKAWFPVTRAPLGFHDVEVHPQADHGSQIRFLVDVPRQLRSENWEASWTINEGIIVTAAWIQR